jgi:hypothetical protein
VFVQTRALERSASDVPEGIVPTAPPALELEEPLVLRVTVLPEGVVVAGVVRGVVVRPLVLGRVAGVVLRGLDAAGAGAGAGVVTAGVAGTSRSCGCDVVSWPASARSRLSSDESRASVLSAVLSFPLQAATASAAHSASGARSRRIYFVMTSLRNGGARRVAIGRSCGTATS